MKRPRRTNSSEEIALTEFKNLLRGAKAPAAALRDHLPRLRLADYAAAAKWLSVTPLRGGAIKVTAMPRSYSEIFRDPVLPFLNFEQWLEWTVGIAVANSKVLSVHLGLYDQLSAAFLEEEYPKAFELLDSAESQCGYSMLTLQLRIALTQLTQGFDAHKQLARSVGEKAGDGSLVHYIAHYTSFRNESAVSARYFRDQYLRHLTAYRLSRSLEAAARYHLLNEVPTTVERIADLLDIEARLSLVDHFEAFLAVASVASVNQTSDSAVAAAWRSPFQNLAQAIPNSRLESIAFAATADPRHLASLIKVDLGPFDSFLRGEYAAAAKASLEKVKAEKGTHIDYDELVGCALAVGASQPDHPMGRLPTALAATMAKGDQGPDEYSALHKVKSNSPFPWAVKALHTAIREIADEPFCDAFFFHNSCGSPPATLNPYHTYTFTKEAAVEYLDACLGVYPDSISAQYVMSQMTDAEVPTEVAPEIKLLAMADSAFRRREYSQAIEAASTLETTGSVYFRQKAIRIRATSLLRAENIEACIHYITSLLSKTANDWVETELNQKSKPPYNCSSAESSLTRPFGC